MKKKKMTAERSGSFDHIYISRVAKYKYILSYRYLFLVTKHFVSAVTKYEYKLIITYVTTCVRPY